jgi:hypothetical protein
VSTKEVVFKAKTTDVHPSALVPCGATGVVVKGLTKPADVVSTSSGPIGPTVKKK